MKHTTAAGMLYHSDSAKCRAWLDGGYDVERCGSCAMAARGEGCPECGKVKKPATPFRERITK